MSAIPTLVTNSMLYEKLLNLEKKIEQIQDKEVEYSIEEISIYKAAKLLRIGAVKIAGYVDSGKLKARVYRDSEKRKHYRFRIKDIRDFQNNNQYDAPPLHVSEVESAESIGRKIFGGYK